MNSNCYALLVSVGNYREMHLPDLPTYEKDYEILKDGLCSGLRFDPEHIRVPGVNGTVTAKQTALALASFHALLHEEDVFVFYFSGHGERNTLVFSDEKLELQSILDYIERMPVGSKIVVIDCCYAGDFSVAAARKMQIEETVASFSGKGVSVFASTTRDIPARMFPDGKSSLYTSLLSAAMKSRMIRKKGKIRLSDLAEEIRCYMDAWNKKFPAYHQKSVYRASLGGTLVFDAEVYEPYRPREIYYETGDYTVCSVKPLSNLKEKRLSAFVIAKTEMDDNSLKGITLEIAGRIKNEDVFSRKNSERVHRGKSADVIWCYFGKDESDLIHHLYFAHTIWGRTKAIREKYFRCNKDAAGRNDISVFRNPSYSLLRKMQKTELSTKAYRQKTQVLLTGIISRSEQFIAAHHEAVNTGRSINEFLPGYRNWIKSVNRIYFALGEMDVPPDGLTQWADEVLDLASCVQNIAFLLEQGAADGGPDERTEWLIGNSVQRYYASLERLKLTEQTMK